MAQGWALTGAYFVCTLLLLSSAFFAYIQVIPVLDQMNSMHVCVFMRTRTYEYVYVFVCLCPSRLLRLIRILASKVLGALRGITTWCLCPVSNACVGSAPAQPYAMNPFSLISGMVH